MAKLSPRRLWRPLTAGIPTRGGAGGFHLPQVEGRTSYIAPAPRPKKRGKKGKKA